MITLTCDGCSKRIEVPDNAAGTTVRCPGCQAPNGVPSLNPTPDDAQRRAADHAADHAAAHAPEQALLYIRTSMFRARPARFSLFALIALAGIGGGIYFLTTKEPALALACALGSLAGIGPLLVWKIQCLGTSLEITSRRTVLNRGLFSKTTTEVRHEDIKNFQIDQSFQQRLFNVGTIGISSSGQDEIEIMVSDVPKPYRVREIIDRHRRR